MRRPTQRLISFALASALIGTTTTALALPARAGELYGGKSTHFSVKIQEDLGVGEVPPKPPELVRTLTAKDNRFEGVHSRGNSLSFLINLSNGKPFWDVSLSAPDGQKLKAGATYRKVQRESSKEAGRAGLEVSGESIGCSRVTGSFTVHTLKLGKLGWIQDLDLSFRQRCIDTTPRSTWTGRLVVHNGPPPGALKVKITPSKVTAYQDGRVSTTFRAACSRKAYLHITAGVVQSEPVVIGGLVNQPELRCYKKTTSFTISTDANGQPLTPGSQALVNDVNVQVRDAAYYPNIEPRFQRSAPRTVPIVAG